MKRRAALSSGMTVIAATSFLLGAAVFAYGADETNSKAARHIQGSTIFSEESPKIKLSVSSEFKYIGTRKINLYGNADAEQYAFAKRGKGDIATGVYLVQFEHFLPSNTLTYNYDSMGQAQVGDLTFNWDVKSWPDLANLIAQDPGSDVASLSKMLATQNLSFPHKTALVRMMHLPTADRRTELMILYFEALPEKTTIPVRKEGVLLNKEAPNAAKLFFEHARQGLVIQSR
jgi:hypothetical protein